MITKENVEKTLEKIRSFLQFEGGGIELVEISDDGIVKVKLTGTCMMCPFAQITFQSTVEKTLKEDLPEIKEVILLR